MAYVDPNCRAIATKAAGGALTESEILDAFALIDERKKRLEAAGMATGKAERIRKWAAEEGERAKIAAAMRKRHAALNAIIRDKVDQQVRAMVASGLKPHQALRAVIEGINSPAPGSRASAAATVQAYEARYLGAMLADLDRDKPHLVAMLADQKLDHDVLTEMRELREGGKPGITGNEDAKYLARVFADYAELSRTEANRLGASIGKLDGWAGVQTHDDVKMLQAGKDAWVGRIIPLLDLERTFPEGVSSTEAADILRGVYDTIITGISNTPSPGEIGQRVGPANLAKSLGKSRVLHFKDADAALTYRDQFGYSNTIAGMFSHLRHVAKINGLMETLGPNPDVMFTSLSEAMKREVRDSATIPNAQKQKLIDRLDTQDGALRQALDVATGLASRPVNATGAKIASDIRAWQSVSKLGAALISSIGDTVTASAAAQFRGSGFLRGLGTQLAGVMRGRPKAEQARISYLLGEGFDGLIGHVTNTFAANDGPRGRMARLQEKFFRWNGLTWWTDVNRAVAGRVIGAELGMWSGTPYDGLDPRFRNVLSQAGIDATTWDVLGKATLTMDNGKPYMTPDMVRLIPDADLAPLAADRIAAAQAAARNPADLAERMNVIMADTRRQLELKMLSYVADQTSSAVIEADARTRRYTTLGRRPGTVAGEAVRFVMQFKGYPLAFTSRVVGRALFAHRKDAGFIERAGHIGSLLAGLTIAGYMSMTAKDMLKGYWPPRDPSDPRTIIAAMQQGGAIGIYSDFLFSSVNRFGGGLTETLAGPSIGSIADLANIGLDARDAAASGGENKFSGAQAFSTVIGNVPFANLHLVKPALDFLFLNALREAISPGYLKRMRTNRAREYGQQKFLPDRAF